MSKQSFHDDRKATGPQLPLDHQSCLLVFTPGTVLLVPLPLTGDFYFGLTGEDGVQFNEQQAAAMNAKISLVGGEMMIEELEGDQEVFINGVHITRAQILISGDVISLGQLNIVLNRGHDTRVGPTLLDMAQMHRRLPLEVERAQRHNRPLSLLSLRLRRLPDDLSSLCEAITGGLRLIDIVAWNGTDEFTILLPETDSSAVVPAQRIIEQLRALKLDVKAGMARCPGDGTDGENLLTGARTAATAAKLNTLQDLRDLGKTVDVGKIAAVAIDPMMKHIYDLVRDVAVSDIPVLVMGETGAGKEIVAQALHRWSPRQRKPLVSINCAALSETLLQSELFGHERGAFTGATATKPGLLESAQGGTVLLDEVGECSIQTQAKLLRVLETKLILRLGAIKEREVDVRVVAATNRDLQEEVAAGNFRKDLYFRLNATTIVLPPLRRRQLDLPVLARLLLEEACRGAKREVMKISEEVVHHLMAYHWPGNVRELKNLMESMVAVVREQELQLHHLPPPLGPQLGPSDPRASTFDGIPALGYAEAELERQRTGSEPSSPTEFRPLADEIKELEHRRIGEALAATDGVRVRAAKLIGMPLRTFVTKLKVHGLG